MEYSCSWLIGSEVSQTFLTTMRSPFELRNISSGTKARDPRPLKVASKSSYFYIIIIILINIK